MNERLKELRKALGFKNQQDFADALNIKRGTIANYEIGRNEPIDAVVTLICSKFNVNEEWLRTGEGDMFIELSRKDKILKWASEALSTESEKYIGEFAEVLDALDVDDWKAIADLAVNLSNRKKKD
jgi:transcriptional regulator with XRE-family HTH domain